jgi:isoquinoline 1-oxidoreductase beta subunit
MGFATMTNNLMNRRQFLKTSALAGGMLLSINLPFIRSATAKQKSQSDWCIYIEIKPDNSIVMASPVMDMGQHMKTTGPMIIADELDLDWQRITFAEDCPAYLSKTEEGNIGYQFSDMGTGGSHAVRRNWDYMRKAGATARRMIIEEAAALWKVSPESLITRASFVVNPNTQQKFSYGYLAKGASRRQIDQNRITLKQPSEYRIMGSDAKTVDLQKMVTGKPLFGIDADYPSALQVVIHRAPAQGASIESYDKAAALAVPGVQEVVEMTPQFEKYPTDDDKQIVSAGIAVVANSLWSALQGKKALKTRWQADNNYAEQTSELQQTQLRQSVASNVVATQRKNEGDVDKALNDASYVADYTYETPLLAHACMEPFNCIADIREQDATVVVGHQFPHMVAEEVQNFAGIDALNVEVISKRMGGGFGRRFERDFVREAIVLSKQLKRPVKITWTREDEIERDYFAPAYVMRVRAGLDDNNQVSAWHHRQAQTRGGARDDCFPAKIVKNYRSENIESPSKIPTGPWRGPAHLQWTFAVESMTDELAHQAKQDPLAFRLAMMKPHQAHEYSGWGAAVIDSGRMAKCYESAANMANWGRELPKGHGLGIAGHFTFGSYAAFVIEVSVSSDNTLTLHNAWGAIDCGFAINPNHIRNQMEGGFIDGLSAALFNKVVVEKGQVINNNFHTLRWMKMKEAPKQIQVDIIQNDYPPTGVGEPPTAPAAAALANAIFAASGQRIRQLPLADSIRI